MINAERSIEIGGRAYPLVFNTNAAFQLELYLKQNKLGTLLDFSIDITSGQMGLLHVQCLFWSSLEGARRKYRTRPSPYTIDEAGDLIDIADLEKISEQLSEMFMAAMPNVSSESKKKEQAETTNGTGTNSAQQESSSASQ